jgi:hypothetical protein
MGFTSKLQGRKILTCCKCLQLKLTFISYSFWNIRRKVFKKKLNLMKKGQELQDLLENCRVGWTRHGAHVCNLTSISYSFWNITRKVLKFKKKIDRMAKPPDTFLEENHPMTISSKFCSYWANGFRQEDFYRNFP